ncbi:hypothetical protein Trydic_g8257 [Trypoxylus dichotomus]
MRKRDSCVYRECSLLRLYRPCRKHRRRNLTSYVPNEDSVMCRYSFPNGVNRAETNGTVRMKECPGACAEFACLSRVRITEGLIYDDDYID